MLTKRILALLAVTLVAGCSLDKQAAPGLAGPSSLGLSVSATASPDVLSQDGKSQSTILVTALDAMGQPMSGLSLRVDTKVGGNIVDFGTLSTKAISTNASGQASLTYQAPPVPPPTVTTDTTVTIEFTPVGTNYANTTARNVQVLLVRPGVLLPPSTAPTALFVFSPAAPAANDNIVFDARQSTGGSNSQITSYDWAFGDGTTGSGAQVTHGYPLKGTYTVFLTVTNDRGVTATTSQAVSIGAPSAPTAAFTYSPTAPRTTTLVSFNAATSSAVPGRLITSYAWEFGDGDPSLPSDTASGQTVTHTFAAAGSYTVTLVVADDLGHTGVTTVVVAVTP